MRTGRFVIAIVITISSQAIAGVTTYTSSAAFDAALASPATVVENFATFTAGTIINPGANFDGITYSSFNLGALGTQGFISNQFNSFSGVSLGADEDNGAAQFFFDGDSFVINFAPTLAIGVFYNVNSNSGTYGITTPVGVASTGSAAFDTSTFVFAGLISTTPFTTATISSNSGGAGTASYNIPEIILGQVPEPASITVTSLGVGLLIGFLRRHKAA